MIPYFEFSVLYIGPVPIQVWGFFVATGMLTSLWILSKRAKLCRLNREHILDQAIWMIVFGFIFARLFHVVFYEYYYYSIYPQEILMFWIGGYSAFGGLFGAYLGFRLFARQRRMKKKRMWKIADVLSFSAIFGWIIGRIGCFMIHDHWGMISSWFPFTIETADGPRLEMALLEIIALLPLAIWFYKIRIKEKPIGWFTATLFVYYGVVRFILDFFRATDMSIVDARFLGLTPGQYFGILIAILGFKMFRIMKKRDESWIHKIRLT